MHFSHSGGNLMTVSGQTNFRPHREEVNELFTLRNADQSEYFNIYLTLLSFWWQSHYQNSKSASFVSAIMTNWGPPTFGLFLHWGMCFCFFVFLWCENKCRHCRQCRVVSLLNGENFSKCQRCPFHTNLTSALQLAQPKQSRTSRDHLSAMGTMA